MTMGDVLQPNRGVAHELAAAGFKVFPCHEGGPNVKAPMPGVFWRSAATSEPRIIDQWWARWPTAAVGINVAESDIIVIDADMKHGIDGVAALHDLLQEHGCSIDDFPHVTTPNNGVHVYFRQRPGHPLGNGTGRLPKGIDVRGAGGLIIAPGTVMGDEREYVPYGDFTNAPVLPDWLFDILKPEHAASQPITSFVPDRQSDGDDIAELEELLTYISADCGYHDWCAVLMGIHACTGGSAQGLSIADRWSATAGSRYPGARAIEKKWRSFKSGGVTKATIAKMAEEGGADLSDIALRHSGYEDRPVTEEDLRVSEALWRSFERKAGIKPQLAPATADDEPADEDEDDEVGGAADYFDAPDSMLSPGGVVGELTDWICEWASEPVRLHAVGAALVIVGTLLGRKVMTKSKPLGTALYVGALTPSGVGKQHPQDCIRIALDQAAGNSGSNAGYIGWQTSVQSLVKMLTEGASRTMIVDEFADKLIGIRSRNAALSVSAISEALRSLWGSTHSGYAPDMSINARSYGLAEMLLRPNLSLYGATTNKDFARSLVSKDVTNGLFNRFLILPRYGPVASQPEREDQISLPRELVERLQWLYNCLPSMQMTMAVRGDGRPATIHLVPFSDEAAAMHEANRALGKQMLAASETDDALVLYGRYAEQIKRIALIVACGRSPADIGAAVISAADMAFAQKLVEYSISQFVLMVRREMVENVSQAQYNLVLGILRDHGRREMLKGQLTKKVKGRVPRKTYEEILVSLTESGVVASREVLPAQRGGRPTYAFRFVGERG